MNLEMLQEFALAGIISLLLVAIFSPEKLKGPVDDYLRLLHPVLWKEEALIYEEILGVHPMYELNDHNRMLSLLHSKGYIERLISPPNSIEEIYFPNRFGRVYVDHIQPFSTITTVSYRLVHSGGGKRNRKPTSFLSHAKA